MVRSVVTGVWRAGWRTGVFVSVYRFCLLLLGTKNSMLKFSLYAVEIPASEADKGGQSLVAVKFIQVCWLQALRWEQLYQFVV